MSALTYVKEHPYTVAGIVAGGLVLYLLYSAAGGGGTTVQGPSGPSDAQVQANTALQLAGYQLTGQNNQLQEQLALGTVNANAALAAKQLDTQLGLYQASIGGDVSMAGIEAQKTLGLATVGAQQSIAGYAQITQQAQIDATRDIALANAATYATISAYNADVTKASYQAQVDIAVSHDQTALGVNSAQQKTAQKSSSNNLIGGVLGTIAAVLPFFSDERLKRDIRFVGRDASGRNWYDFRYSWDAPNITRRGVIAQEILRTDPDAVSVGPFDYLMVNYARLN
jgi:hypothetical protein